MPPEPPLAACGSTESPRALRGRVLPEKIVYFHVADATIDSTAVRAPVLALADVLALLFYFPLGVRLRG